MFAFRYNSLPERIRLELQKNLDAATIENRWDNLLNWLTTDKNGKGFALGMASYIRAHDLDGKQADLELKMTGR